MNTQNHEEAVSRFLKDFETKSPERYAELNAKYPVISPNRIRRLRRRERCVGLLGLQPIALPASVLSLHNLDGLFEE